MQLVSDESQAMQRRTRAATGLGDSDLAAIRLILDTRRLGGTVSPKDIAATLRLTTAAASGLVDRLENAGYIRRAPHPVDRRAIIVEPTESAADVAATLSEIYTRLLDLAAGLSDRDTDVVLTFLRRMQEEIELIARA